MAQLLNVEAVWPRYGGIMVDHKQRGRQTTGFTLIEIMVSITILSVGVLVLGGFLLRSSRSAEATSAISYQTAIMAAEFGRIDAIPFDLLAAGTTCETVTASPMPHTRCTTITNVSAKLRRVSVVVTPTGNPLLYPDSVVIERSISGNGTPLKTP
jgi:prepilin-type N-terminal cleavage/methylation domain-containing protein